MNILLLSLLTKLSLISAAPQIGVTARHKAPVSDTFVCPESTGTFPNTHTCESYWICEYGAPLATTCNFGLIYNHKIKNCDWANINVCTVIDGVVVRDWTPPPAPTAAPIPLLNANGEPVDLGYNKAMKASFVSSQYHIDLRFNMTKKGQEQAPALSPYEFLIAKWKFAQKGKPKVNHTMVVEHQMTGGQIRDVEVHGPQSYVLPENVTPAPRRLYTEEPIGDKPLPCHPKRCRLPDCYCDASNIPGNLTADETPQMVLVTFDDSVNYSNLDLLKSLFSPNRTNPNGCPISGTFFVTNAWTDYKLVENFYEAGHEMASHSLSHVDMSAYNEKQFRNEIVGEAQVLDDYGHVNLSDIVGMRAPFLGIGGNTMFRMLWNNGFLYDSSIPSQVTNPPLWPYTFDTPMPHKCFQEPCPNGYFPGLWEVPMTYYQGLNDFGCSMYDACVHPGELDDVAELFYTNFMKHYETNRSPYLLSAHTSWYLNSPLREQAMIKFMERALKLGDVWFVTVRQAIQWMQHPTPISKITDFPPWQCKRKPT